MRNSVKTSFIMGLSVLSAIGGLILFGSCGGASGEITVISREEGSGTRGAFVELFGVQQKNESGETVDMTVETADVTNSTAVVLSGVAGNKRAVGYISLGSLNNSVKALAIDGVRPSAAAVADGSYTVSRPFNLVVRNDRPTDTAATDFISFMLSAEGQAVTQEAGYTLAGSAAPYTALNVTGKITVAGSSSVTPLMEKLKEAYALVKPGVSVEIQQSDSTMGVANAVDGVCDIGMASRELKDSELEKGVSSVTIAHDGIAVIVNPGNPLNGLQKEQVRDIYTGKIKTWTEIPN